ncbi:MAG: thioredoxin domain-containing protein [Bacillota bacterium]
MAKRKRLDPLKISLLAIGALFVFFIATIIINRPESWEEHITTRSDEETYFVYVYSETCSACQVIANDVADFTASNAMDIEVVPVDIYSPTVPKPPSSMSTPTMYVVHNEEIVDTRVGSSEVLSLFNEVKNGTFQP